MANTLKVRKAPATGSRKRNPWALDDVAYDKKAAKLVLKLPGDVALLIPIGFVEELAALDAAMLSRLYLTPTGETIALDEADIYISTRGLIADVFAKLPSAFAATHLGRRGGSSTSDAKRSAAMENGRKGGRPSASPDTFKGEATHSAVVPSGRQGGSNPLSTKRPAPTEAAHKHGRLGDSSAARAKEKAAA
jgi:hypothetical protein